MKLTALQGLSIAQQLHKVFSHGSSAEASDLFFSY